MRFPSQIIVSVCTTHVSLCVDLLRQFVSVFLVCSVALKVCNDVDNSNAELSYEL